MVAVWWLMACGPGVIEQYASEREQALLYATEVPANWAPDASLRLSEAAISQAVGAAMRATVSGDMPSMSMDLPLGQKAVITPQLAVNKASVTPTDVCSPCLAFDGSLLGKAQWSVSSLTGSFPFEVGASGVLEIEVTDGQVLRTRVRHLNKVQVRVMELGNFSLNPSTTLEKGLQKMLFERLQPIELARLDQASIPVRALKLKTTTSGLTLDLLTNVPDAQPLPPMVAASGDVELAISESALLGLARRAAFNEGTVAMDTAVDPRVLMVSGDKFTLGLRLWRLVGRGWWRDYTVTGRIVIKNGDIKFQPDNVTEGAKSPGAGLVDPLAALAEGAILSTVEKGVKQSLPASRTQSIGNGTRLYSELTSVEGREGVLIARGKIGVLVQ